jgi:hypothetical protein
MRVSGHYGTALLILLMVFVGSALPVHAAPVWNVQVVDDRAALRNGISIAVDSNDTPHMVYVDSENGTYYVPGSTILNQEYLMYASLTDSGWNIQTVDAMDRTEWQGSYGFVGYSALAFDSNDNPHITYNSLDQVKYAVWT